MVKLSTIDKVTNTISKVLPTVSQEKLHQIIERPKNSQNGDYALPTFFLARILHKSPQIIAKNLANQINKQDFEKVNAVGAYVNFYLKKQQVGAQIVNEVLAAPTTFGSRNLGHLKTVVIDYSSPNIAKPMGMGHLRSTMIGEAIARILEKEQYRLIRVDYLGDWGTQFGKLMAAYKMWGSERAIRKDPINTLLKYYVKINTEAADHPEYTEAGRNWFAKLEHGDQEAWHLWKKFRTLSLQRFQKVYQMLDVHFDSYNGEAHSAQMMNEPIQLLKEKKLLEPSRGAQIVNLSKYNLTPPLIIKSNGTTTYITRDLATALFRKRMYGHVKSLYVVGAEQENYYHQLKAVLKEMGFTWWNQLKHISFGLMTLNGKKMSTRKGNVISLEDVLNDSIKLAKKEIAKKNPDLKNIDEVANAVGVGAVIFHDLKNNRRNSINFKLKDVVKFVGETGPYVQYAHARAESLLKKANVDVKQSDLSLLSADEWPILSFVDQYAETIKRAAQTFDPSLIAKFALKLAKKFNQYYANHKVIDNDKAQGARLATVKVVSIVLKDALSLLDVKAPNEM